MIINSAPQNEAIMSNVGQIGEFRIRNSAKAFNILSSGLYANKIKAIIRELSCNAVDSHVAAGKADTPFDVHLPNSLEPWFTIRDYGTGLNHEQVTNIYTTYFESTKTDSNAFIGALGLGSKSPFSYTDNFTVTAVKDGSKRIYTAFINEQGVPSIALMSDHDTDEPNGVEVKFAVNDQYDFGKFKQEAYNVYQYFKLQPVVSGASGFKVAELQYRDKNIIPGVHAMKDGRTVAIMGNIAYPIDVPNSESNLGDLRHLLGCNLVMEFDIGELDFQASREGLSYIPSTIEAIKKKLAALNAVLSTKLTDKANKIDNLWERLDFLVKEYESPLWSAAVVKYITDTKFDLFVPKTYNRRILIKLNVTELAQKFNIAVKSFHRSHSSSVCSNIKLQNSTTDNGIISYWQFYVDNDINFIVNDTKVGAFERAKYHFRKKGLVGTAFVLEKADKTKEMDTKGFFESIYNPPEKQIMVASVLEAKDRAKIMGRNVTIMKLETRERGSWSRRHKHMVWTDAGKADSFDSKTTHYYVPLKGFESLGKVTDVKNLYEKLNSSGIYKGEIYGVRKADMEYILTQKNWVDLDTMVVDKLSKLNHADVMGLVKYSIEFDRYFQYDVFNQLGDTSPYKKLYNTFKDVKAVDGTIKNNVEFLCNVYNVTTNQNVAPTKLICKYRDEISNLKKRYPLLNSLSRYDDVNRNAIAEYILLIDEKKGLE